MATISGRGVQSPGQNKVGLWNAKTDLPNFDGQMKIRIDAWNTDYYSDSIHPESGFFNLDTKNPSTPTVNSYPAKTAIYNRAFAGAKETSSSLNVNGEAVVPVNGSTTWVYQSNLSNGANLFVLKSLDAMNNESLPAQINITYDPNYFICGDLDGNEVINVIDVSMLIDVAFRNGIPPANFNRGDLNGDGVYDIFDVSLLINHAFRGAPAPTGCLSS